MSTPAPIHPSPPTPQHTSPPITIILTLVLLIFFFVCFFSMYFCRCFMQNLLYTWHLRYSFSGSQIAGPPVSKPGLDPLIVQSYPTFSYSNVKEYRREKYGLECAICLVEFVDSDIVRLLTPCCHVFHQQCIDLWLESHKTCPVCRRDLASKVESTVKCRLDEESEVYENEAVDRDSFRITIKEDNEDDQDERMISDNACVKGDEHGTSKVDKFLRSHSTGHSIIRNREQAEDRFTLVLPDHVKSEIIRGHNASRSWTTYGEYKNRFNKGNSCLAEVSELSSKV